MMRFAVPLLLLLLAACATQSPKAEFQNNAHACSLVSAVECATMLEQKKITGRAQSEIMMSVALTALTRDDPDFALPYLDVIVEHDPTYALAFQNRGAASAMLAVRGLQQGKTVRPVGDYLFALQNYARAIELDPDNEGNYSVAIAILVQLKKCDEARALQETHQARFGATDEQARIAEVIAAKCAG